MRPMYNLLLSPNFFRFLPCSQMHKGMVPHCSRNPLPGKIEALVETQVGVRRIIHKEFARGLGFTKDEAYQCDKWLMNSTTSLYHYL